MVHWSILALRNCRIALCMATFNPFSSAGGDSANFGGKFLSPIPTKPGRAEWTQFLAKTFPAVQIFLTIRRLESCVLPVLQGESEKMCLATSTRKISLSFPSRFNTRHFKKRQTKTEISHIFLHDTVRFPESRQQKSSKSFFRLTAHVPLRGGVIQLQIVQRSNRNLNRLSISLVLM